MASYTIDTRRKTRPMNLAATSQDSAVTPPAIPAPLPMPDAPPPGSGLPTPAPEYDDRFNAMGRLDDIFSGEAGSQIEGIRAAGEAAKRGFRRRSYGMAGNLAQSLGLARLDQESGAAVSRANRDQMLEEAALASEFLQPKGLESQYSDATGSGDGVSTVVGDPVAPAVDPVAGASSMGGVQAGAGPMYKQSKQSTVKPTSAMTTSRFPTMKRRAY